VEFDYEKVPVKVTFGSPASCPLGPTGETQVDWVGVVERARGMKDPFIIRSYIPVGRSASLLLEMGSFDESISW
jgi:hypothetical protein